MNFNRLSFLLLILFTAISGCYAQYKSPLFESGELINFQSLILNQDRIEPLRWIDVNTSDTTWWVDNDKLVCKGWPIGVVRSEKMYQNFILNVEWRYMDKGANSGIFVWCDAMPEDHTRFPSGVEVQMLELDWVNQNVRNGAKAPVAYVHGELFGARKTTVIPDNPRGDRSKSIENRCLGVGEWNKYTVVCIDGTIKLAVNGKFVNGIRSSS